MADIVLRLGAVYNPVYDEMYTAELGQGARFNGQPISVSQPEDLLHSLLTTGFAYDVNTSTDDNFDYFRAFVLTGQAIRRDGSAALDLCYLACGRFDGFWELKLKPWDTAAGLTNISAPPCRPPTTRAPRYARASPTCRDRRPIPLSRRGPGIRAPLG